MKKAKFLSAFLSLTLSMTSFAAVPVTSYAAENDPTPVTVTATTTAPIMTTTAADIGQMADYQAKVKFSFIDNHTYIPVEGLDVKLIDSSGNEVLSFNTTETPEIMADISYRASSSTSARYTLELNGITRQYKPNNNFTVYLSPINNGTTLDYTIRLEHTTDTGYSSPYIPDDPSFCFNTTTFYRDMGDNIVIPFSNTDDADVSASIDNQDIEIVSVSTKNIILKASESGSGVLTVESENGRKITADIIIRSASAPVTGTGTTTKPVTTTTTTTSATNELFHCSSCDRDVPWDERVSGPLGVEVCRECYETKHIYLGTTTSPDILTGTTTAPVKTTSTTTATGKNGEILDENGNILIVNGTSAVVSQAVHTTTTIATSEEPVSTTTVIMDYRTMVEYDNSPMTVGETRQIHFYHPKTKTASKADIMEVSDNISVQYEEGNDTLTIKALKSGKAKLYICCDDCAFGAYVNIDVISAEPIKGDSNCDGQVSMADAVIVMQSIANPDKYGINGTEKTRITEQGQKNADIVGNSDGLTTADALAVQKIMLKLN